MLGQLSLTIDDRLPVPVSMRLNATSTFFPYTTLFRSPPHRRSVQMLTFGADCVVRVVCTFWTAKARVGWTLAWVVTGFQLPSLTLALMVIGWSRPWVSNVVARPVTVKAEPRLCWPAGMVTLAGT